MQFTLQQLGGGALAWQMSLLAAILIAGTLVGWLLYLATKEERAYIHATQRWPRVNSLNLDPGVIRQRLKQQSRRHLASAAVLLTAGKLMRVLVRVGQQSDLVQQRIGTLFTQGFCAAVEARR